MTASPPITWGPQFRTGIKLIDEQHQVLFDIINRIEGHLELTPLDDEELRRDIDEVVAYAMYHFVSEESLAYRLGATANMQGHLAGHNGFRRELAEMKARVDADHGELGAVSAVLLRYLKHWLTSHIMRTDIELGREIAARGGDPGSAPGTVTESCTIAVVEGQADLRDEVVYHLVHSGHRAIGIPDALALRQHMAERGSDILVIDVSLPQIDALDLVDRYGGRPDVAIVLLMPDDNAKARADGYCHGADACLAKPVSLQELVAVVDHLAARLRQAA